MELPNIEIPKNIDLISSGGMTRYHPNNQIKEKWEWNLSKVIYKKFTHTGVLVARLVYQNKNLDGLQELRFPDGGSQISAYYKDGKKHGIYVESYLSYGSKSRHFYVDGKKEGEWWDWDIYGKVEKTYYFNNEQINPSTYTGEYIGYYSDTKVKTKCTYKDGKLNEEYYEFYQNGNYKLKCHYKNGKLDGGFLSYFPSGVLSVSCFYNDGKKNGGYQQYDRNKNIQIKAEMKNDKYNGQYTQFKNSYRYITCNMVDGEYDGEYIDYHDNMKIRTILHYINGKLDGEQLVYNQEGELEKTYVYKNGNKQGYCLFYDKVGLKRMRKYDNDRKIIEIELDKYSEEDRRALFKSTSLKKRKRLY